MFTDNTCCMVSVNFEKNRVLIKLKLCGYDFKDRKIKLYPFLDCYPPSWLHSV